MAISNILSVISVVFYLVAYVTHVNSGKSEIRELPFCNPDEVNTEHK
jgi:hypothetical protein